VNERGLVIEGEDTWSESAMVLYFDDALRNGLSLRISRFPDKGVTWVWCHVVHDGAVYTYTEPRLGCSSARTDPNQAHAAYDAPGADVAISRAGSSRELDNMSFSARLLAHRGEGGSDGPGTIPVSLQGTFAPGHLRSGSPRGRFERTGLIGAVVEVAGKRVALSGLGKAHEQSQTRARFGPAFTSAMLWGPSASLVALNSEGRSFGNHESADGDRAVGTFEIEPWSAERSFSVLLADRASLAGKARTIHKYHVPIFSRLWHGHIVAADVGGQRMVGMINDWHGGGRSGGAG
jgi:hypothetical protein